MRLVVVHWKDHWGDSRHGEWQRVAELRTLEPIEIMSVGWLVRDDDVLKVLASTLDDDNCTNILCLMASSVISITDLKGLP